MYTSLSPTFNLTVSFLQSFEDLQAENSFVKVLDADPEFEMVYWGVAMSIYHAARFPPTEKNLTRLPKSFPLLNQLRRIHIH